MLLAIQVHYANYCQHRMSLLRFLICLVSVENVADADIFSVFHKIHGIKAKPAFK